MFQYRAPFFQIYIFHIVYENYGVRISHIHGFSFKYMTISFKLDRSEKLFGNSHVHRNSSINFDFGGNDPAYGVQIKYRPRNKFSLIDKSCCTAGSIAAHSGF